MTRLWIRTCHFRWPYCAVTAAGRGRAFLLIDVEFSVSRAMNDIVQPAHLALIRQFRQLLALYQQNKDLISIGAYQRGSDPRIDAAIRLKPLMDRFLQQDTHDAVSYDRAIDELMLLMNEE